jgi:ethanolamine utilization protein EutP (predicted NTPase)
VKHDRELSRKPEIIFLTKTDLATSDEIAEKVSILSETGKEVVLVSILDDELIKRAGDRIANFVSKES